MSEPRRSSCPIACALDRIGDRWTLLVLRDLLIGKHYFDEIMASPEGIASNVLAERLKRLEAWGMVEASADSVDRRRKRYRLTPLGRSFGPVLEALARWGLQHIGDTERWPEVVAALTRRRRREG